MVEEPTIGSSIREARRASDLTQRALAESLGIPIGVIERLETGIADPERYLERIAASTDTSLGWLIDGAGAPRSPRTAAEDLDARAQAIVRAERQLREAAD